MGGSGGVDWGRPTAAEVWEGRWKRLRRWTGDGGAEVHGQGKAPCERNLVGGVLEGSAWG